MWLVAIAWIYVVGLMALTEKSMVAGVLTFVGYCAIPLSILFYITGGKRRRAAREARGRDLPGNGGRADRDKHERSDSDDGDSSSDSSDGGGDGGGGGD